MYLHLDKKTVLQQMSYLYIVLQIFGTPPYFAPKVLQIYSSRTDDAKQKSSRMLCVAPTNTMKLLPPMTGVSGISASNATSFAPDSALTPSPDLVAPDGRYTLWSC